MIWLWSLFIRAHKNDLEFSDLYRCPKSDETHRVRHKLEINWDKQLKSKGKSSLYWALFASFAPEFIVLCIPDAIREVGLNLFQSYCIVYLVRYFNNDPNTSQWWAQWAAVGIVLTSIVSMLIVHVNLATCSKVGLRIRAACCALIYRKFMYLYIKAMRLSHSSLGQTTVGQILNIMSNDVHRFDELAFNSRSLFVAPLQATVVTYLLWPYLRWACLAGMGILALFIPFQVLMSRMFRRVRQKTAELTDSRIRLMHEIIAGMRVIKMYAWEQPFALLVATARKSEVKQILIKRIQNFLLLEEMSGLDEREGKDNEAFISGKNEIILGVMENTSSNEEKGVFMDKMSVRWNN
ncbi:unnamed protein product, partial [Medioppia subpectinata]